MLHNVIITTDAENGARQAASLCPAGRYVQARKKNPRLCTYLLASGPSIAKLEKRVKARDVAVVPVIPAARLTQEQVRLAPRRDRRIARKRSNTEVALWPCGL
jgi:hypothetical protein